MARLVGFRAKNVRSLKSLSLGTLSAEGIPLPKLVLLHGENDVGKSNILRAVETWFILLRVLNDDQWRSSVIHGVKLPLESLLSLFTHGTFELELTGVLALEVGAQDRALSGHLTIPLSFRYQTPAGQSLEEYGELSCSGAWFQVAHPDGILGEPQAVSGPHILPSLQGVVEGTEELLPFQPMEPLQARALMRALFSLLESPWVRIGAERRWHKEQARDPQMLLPWPPPLDCSDLKQRLFRARNARSPLERARFEKHFSSLLKQAQLGLEQPSTVVEAHGGPGLYVGDFPIEERGSGPQQWALIAGVLSMSQPVIAGIEEPEAHLGWPAQQLVSRALLQELNSSSGLRQLWVTSHSPVVFHDLMEQPDPADQVWFEVFKDEDGYTKARRQIGKESRSRLEKYVAPMDGETPPPRDASLSRVYAGGFIRLGPQALEHLGIREGHTAWIGYRLVELKSLHVHRSSHPSPAVPALELFGEDGYELRLDSDASDANDEEARDES